MKVEQIKDVVNNVYNEITGKSDVVAEDLSNIVDIGNELLDTTNKDRAVNGLIDKVGKINFENKSYTVNVPPVLRDSWDFGAVLQKIRMDTPTADINDSWNLEDGKSYPTDIYYKPTVHEKFYSNKNTFDIKMSFTEKQLHSAFNSVGELNSFLSMIDNAINNAKTVRTNGMISRTINNMIAHTFKADFPTVTDGVYSGMTGTRAVNVLKLYNDKYGTTLESDKALNTPEFMRFAVTLFRLYANRLTTPSTLFNIGGVETITPSTSLVTVGLADFVESARTYLYSDTFNRDDVVLPNMSEVPYWQGSGKDFSFANVSDIHTNIKDGDSTVEIATHGVIATMFDKDSVAVCNENDRVTTQFNARGEFTNNYYKFDCSYLNDMDSNFIVFYVA